MKSALLNCPSEFPEGDLKNAWVQEKFLAIIETKTPT